MRNYKVIEFGCNPGTNAAEVEEEQLFVNVEAERKPLFVKYDGKLYKGVIGGAYQITLNPTNEEKKNSYMVEVISRERRNLLRRMETHFYDKEDGKEIIFKDKNTGWEYMLKRNADKGEGPYFNGQLDMKLIGF